MLNLFVVMLISCQHHQYSEEHVAKLEKPHKAASYNTQLGIGYLKKGNIPRAKKKLLIALSQDPDSPIVNAAMAYFLEKTGEVIESETYYKKAIKFSGKSGAQLNNYGAFLCRQGHYREAEAYFLQAVHDMSYENTAHAYENAGLCLLQISDDANAKRYFQKALEHNPMQKQSLYELVNIEKKQHQFDKALALLQQYAVLTYKTPSLLQIAMEMAQKTGKPEAETQYRLRLSQVRRFSETQRSSL